MSAGLPGLGLGGLFFILSALLAPFIEVGRIALGRRRTVDWPQVWRQFALALTMIAAVDLTLRSIYAVSHLLGLGDTPRIDVVTVIPLVPVAITACLLAAVLLAAKAVDLATPVLRGLPPISTALPSRTRVLALTGVVGAVWFALLFSGANDLSRLPGSDEGVESVPAGPAPADSRDAGGLMAVAGAGDDFTEIDPAEPASEAPVTAAASQDATGAEGSSASEGEAREGSPAPATTAPAPSPTPTPATPVEPAGPPPTSDAPETSGPPDEPTAPAPEPVPEPPPSQGGGPPADSGPPASAGPPEHSNAPPHAGAG